MKTPLPEPAESHGSQMYVFTREEVARHNAMTHKRLKDYGNLRFQRAYFRCLWPCTKAHYEKVRKAAIDRWVGQMEKEGWALASRVMIRPDKHRTSTRMRGDWFSVPVMDEVEIPVVAAFRKLDLQIIRTEVLVSD